MRGDFNTHSTRNSCVHTKLGRLSVKHANYETFTDEDSGLIKNRSTITKNVIEAPPLSTDMPGPVIDTLLNTKGYNLYTLKVIGLCMLVLMIEGLQMSLFSSMIIPLTKYYNISDDQVKFLSSILFVGVGIGSFISGSSTVKYGRPLVINFFLFVMFISTFMMAFAANFIIFGICRFVAGFGLGLIVPTTINLLTEFLPLQNRALVLTSIWVGFGLGAIYLQISMLCIMPNLEADKLPLTLLAASLLTLIAFVLNAFFLEDSPRNLILMEKFEEGIFLLEKITKSEDEIKISDDLKVRIYSEVREGTNKNISNNLSEIFRPKYIILTLLLSIIWFLNSVVTYGPYLISTLTMQQLGHGDNRLDPEGHPISGFSNKEIIINQIFINLILMPSNFLGGILSEISFLGRNKSTILNVIFSFFMIIFIVACPEYFTLGFGLLQSFLGIAFSINTSYSCEVYPTKIRDQAIGFLFFCTRLGGFSSQIIYLYLQKFGVWVPYYFTGLIIAIIVVLLYLLPYETYGQPLDVDYSANSNTNYNCYCNRLSTPDNPHIENYYSLDNIEITPNLKSDKLTPNGKSNQNSSQKEKNFPSEITLFGDSSKHSFFRPKTDEI